MISKLETIPQNINDVKASLDFLSKRNDDVLYLMNWQQQKMLRK